MIDSIDKKILWLCHWESPYEEEWRGGMGKYMYKLAKELSQDYKLKIDIITPNFADYPSKQVLCQRVNLFRLDVPVNGNIRTPKNMNEFSNGVSDFLEKRSKDYALVHAHYWSSHVAGEMVSQKGTPYILQLHQLDKPMYVAFQSQDLDYPLNEQRYEREKSAVENSDRTIFVSNTQLEEFKKYYYDERLPKKIENKISVILNGADVDFLKPTKRPELRHKYDLPLDSFVISYCGRLDPDKAVDRILYSIPILIDSLPKEISDKVRVMITGKGKEIKYLENVVNELKISDRVQFYGYQTGKSLVEKFQVSDVGIIPSIHETFGLSVIEFMAVGKPVIVWKGSGGPEEIVNGSAGKIVSNYQEMASAMKDLALNSEKRKKMGSKARKRCREIYNWDRVAKETYNIYQKIISESKKD